MGCEEVTEQKCDEQYKHSPDILWGDSAVHAAEGPRQGRKMEITGATDELVLKKPKETTVWVQRNSFCRMNE